MGFFDSIKEGFRTRSEQKRKDREMMERLRKEAGMQEQIEFEKQFKIDAKEVAIAKAKRDSARLSGLQKIRAANRLRNLQKTDQKPDSALAKFATYTQKNMARREENLKATKERQAEATKTREERLEKIRSRTAQKPFK